MAETVTLKPIIFSPPMVQAILGGRKTVTRRLVKPQIVTEDSGIFRWKNYAMCDVSVMRHYSKWRYREILWVREKWSRYLDLSTETPTWKYAYFADGRERYPVGRDENGQELTTPVNWRPSIHMPKDAARLFLRVCDVRVVRLQEISGDLDELEREGVNIAAGMFGASAGFSKLWDDLRKPADRVKYGWDANPWVWRIEFQRCEKPDGWPGGGA